MPSACEKCLGDNPYVQVLKEDYGAEWYASYAIRIARFVTDKTQQNLHTSIHHLPLED
jgi:pre-mRNA-splicing factor RBM22/SLT11